MRTYPHKSRRRPPDKAGLRPCVQGGDNNWYPHNGGAVVGMPPLIADCKFCLVCERWWPSRAHFYRDVAHADGFSSACMECQKARWRR